MIDESPNLPEPPRGDLLDDVLEQEEELSEHLQDPMLYEAFLQLTDKQKKCLHKFIFMGYPCRKLLTLWENQGKIFQKFIKGHSKR